MEKKKNHIWNYGKMVGLILCVLIGGYGIWKAPASDQEEMKQELMQNEEALKKRERAARRTGEEVGKQKPEAGTDGQERKKPEGSTSQPQRTGDISEEKQLRETISVIGDSVFLGASPSFQKLYKHAEIDAKISRQVRHGIDVAKKMNKEGKLGDIVIISLGTNGNFNSVTGQELIDYLGTDRTIYWINAYGKNLSVQRDVNETIEELTEQNENVYLISWAKEARKHPDWFYQDGIHLNTAGQDGFSHFIQKEIEGD